MCIVDGYIVYIRMYMCIYIYYILYILYIIYIYYIYYIYYDIICICVYIYYDIICICVYRYVILSKLKTNDRLSTLGVQSMCKN